MGELCSPHFKQCPVTIYSEAAVSWLINAKLLHRCMYDRDGWSDDVIGVLLDRKPKMMPQL